jgi:site-specific DNA recombinase
VERRKSEIAREINRAIDAIVKAGVDPTTLAGTIKRLEVEREEIEGKLAAIKESDKIITLHPAAIERYRHDLEKLAGLLPRPDLSDGDELGEKVRRLISSVIVHAPPNSEKLKVEIKGRLEELLAAPTFMGRSSGGSLVVAGSATSRNSLFRKHCFLIGEQPSFQYDVFPVRPSRRSCEVRRRLKISQNRFKSCRRNQCRAR